MKRGAIVHIKELETLAKASLSPEGAKNLTAEDKVALERGLRTLRPAFDGLANDIIDPLRGTDKNRAMLGYVKLWELMTAVFQIGARGVVTDSAKAFFAPEIQRQTIVTQVATARAAKAAKATVRKAKLEDAIWAASEQMNIPRNGLSASKEFADRIRSKVLEDLNLPPDHKGNPSVGTIISTISHMKKSVKT